MNRNEIEVGSAVTLTQTAETSEGYTYRAGEVGELVAQGRNGDPIVLVGFDDGRPPLTCTPGEDCEIGRVLIA